LFFKILPLLDQETRQTASMSAKIVLLACWLGVLLSYDCVTCTEKIVQTSWFCFQLILLLIPRTFNHFTQIEDAKTFSTSTGQEADLYAARVSVIFLTNINTCART
jgi:hypothetical protein